MIIMPPNYTEELRRIKQGGHFTSLSRIPYEDYVSNRNIEQLYYTRSHVMHESPLIEVQVNYALRSFVHPCDNSIYGLFLVTTKGIYRNIHRRSPQQEPKDFRDLIITPHSRFTCGDLITLYPDTRQIIVLHNVRYTEVINGKGVPNTFFLENSNIDPKSITSHYIILESENLSEPITTEYSYDLLLALRNKRPYIWVRSDNYIPIQKLRSWNQNF